MSTGTQEPETFTPSAAPADPLPADPLPADPLPADPLPANPGGRRHVTERESRQVAEAARETTWQHPSFAKELYLGRFDLDLVHPHPQSNADDVARGEAFLADLRSVCEKIDGRQIERQSLVRDEDVAELARIGSFGMKIPLQYGGLGLTTMYYSRALMLAGSVHPTLGALLSAHQSIGVPQPVKMFGTEDQKQRFLPRCAAGAVTAFLLTEPDVGSDPARLGSTARLTEDGTAYLLDGVKLWTTNGVVAELVVVMAYVARTETSKGGITAFVVETGSEGVTVENRNVFMGLKGIENGVTRFHRVRVPVENRLGREGEGLKIALSTLNTGRLSLPAMCAGAGKWALKIAREWSSERVQWGKPVGQHGAVAEKISFIAATAFGLEAVLELSCQLADAGSQDIRIEAALAKLWSSEMAWTIGDELVQILGGRGYETADSKAARGERAVPAEQILRDLRINRIFEGSTEIMHLLIAREALDAHMAVAGELANLEADLMMKAKAGVSASGFYAKWFPKLVAGQGNLPTSYAEFGPLATHLRYIERHSRKLARQTFYGMSRWQAKLEHKQSFLGRIVDIGAELFAMAAACSRAAMLNTPEARDLADAFCGQARLRVETLFERLWTNTDDTDKVLADRVLEGDFGWLEAGVIDQSEGTGPWISTWAPGPSEHENVWRLYSM